MIGLLGGTFDPIHYGHLRAALDVFEALQLQELRFIPLHRAVHRPQPQASAALRLAMVKAAIADQAGFTTDAREIQRDGPSQTYQTLVSIRAELGAEQPLCLLIGGDAFNSFLDWHRPLDILTLAHLVIMQRPGTPMPRDVGLRDQLQTRRTQVLEDLQRTPAGHIWLQSVTQLAISSTTIRQIIQQGHNPRFLIPEAVLNIIRVQDLYLDQDHDNTEPAASC
jgi:nicotinate-nucleotide adenylyltransferase